jgi:membrane associated rhomboid family serine protease
MQYDKAENDEMGGQDGNNGLPPRRRREPAFNLPGFILAFAMVLLAIHAVRAFVLSRSQDLWTIILFAFIPARYGAAAESFPVPGAALWSPVTYSFLHGDWSHLFVNLLWLIAFGSPVARRLGPVRVLALSIIASVAGAAAHFAFYAGEAVPMVGASAVVSGYMGAAARFAFQPGRPGALNIEGPALPLLRSFSDARFMSFLAVWMVLNLIFGSGLIPTGGQGASIAWQAHVGGFLGGILAFSLLDPPLSGSRRRETAA